MTNKWRASDKSVAALVRWGASVVTSVVTSAGRGRGIFAKASALRCAALLVWFRGKKAKRRRARAGPAKRRAGVDILLVGWFMKFTRQSKQAGGAGVAKRSVLSRPVRRGRPRSLHPRIALRKAKGGAVCVCVLGGLVVYVG